MVVPRKERRERSNTPDDRSDHTDCEDSSDDEAAIALKRQKHVEHDDSADGVYFLDVHASSTHTTFPAPGKASAGSLRRFLEDRLTADLVKDENGQIMSIAQVAEDDLPALQALVWRNNLDGDTAKPKRLAVSKDQIQTCTSFAQFQDMKLPCVVQKTRKSKDALLLATHITFITELPDANHIFITHDKPTSTCELPICRTRGTDQSSPSSVVTLEPLIHWGTVTAVTEPLPAGGMIHTFRRDGEMCGDPLWALAVKRFTPEHPTTYCLECLELLMATRTEAWDFADRSDLPLFTAVSERQMCVPQAGGRRIAEDLKVSQCGPASKYDTDVSRAAAVEGERKPENNEAGDKAMTASLRLDGTCDPHPARAGRVTDSSDSTVAHSICDTIQARAERQHRLSDKTSLYLQSAFPLSSAKSIDSKELGNLSTWALVNPAPPLPSTASTANSLNFSDIRPPLVPERAISIDYQLNASQSSTTTGTSGNWGTKRKFGRELDTNTVVGQRKEFTSVEPKIKMPRKKNTSGNEDAHRHIPTPSKPVPKPKGRVTRVAKAQSTKVNTPDRNLNQISSSSLIIPTLIKEAVKTSHKIGVSPKPTKASSRKPKATEKKVTATKATAKRTPAEKATVKSSTKPKNDTPVPPFLAKHDPINLTAIPPTISQPTYLAHHSRRPSPTENICTCRKPTGPPSTQLAQCSTAHCVIIWLHYACLDKSAKISSRHGRLVCQHCRTEALIKKKEGEERGVAVVEEMFSREDVVGALPGVGGAVGLVKPYGLGDDVHEYEYISAPEAVKRKAGALGELGFFGYAVSRAWMLGVAYGDGAARVCGEEEGGKMECIGEVCEAMEID